MLGVIVFLGCSPLIAARELGIPFERIDWIQLLTGWVFGRNNVGVGIAMAVLLGYHNITYFLAPSLSAGLLISYTLQVLWERSWVDGSKREDNTPIVPLYSSTLARLIGLFTAAVALSFYGGGSYRLTDG